MNMLNVVQEERIAILTINRPERRNALNSELAARLSAELRRLAQSREVSAVILTGSLPGFCAGSDLKELAGKTTEEMRLIELAKGGLVADILSIAPPVIAAVEGFALGGGFALAAACDFVVTGADAKWHMPEAQNGWIPPWGLESIKLRVGHYKARQLVCGLRLSGDEAVAAGVADKVTAPGQALDGARKIAADLAAIDPQVLATIKKFFGSDIDKQLGKSDEKSAALFKGNCQYEPAVSTLSRFGVRNV